MDPSTSTSIIPPKPKHLTLHIPNSYPRSIPSPTSRSNSPSPASTRAPTPIPILQSCSQVQDDGKLFKLDFLARFHEIFKSRKCQAETARDFLARERTFFSWVRLSQILSVLSGAILLRLKPKSIQRGNVDGNFKTATTKGQRLERQSRRMHGISPLKRYLIRKINQDRERSKQTSKSEEWKKIEPQRQSRIHQFHFTSPQTIISSIENGSHQPILSENSSVESSDFNFFGLLHEPQPSISIPSVTSSNPNPISISSNPLLTNQKLSLSIGIFFFILAMSSLLISWFDYLKIVKYLELTDRDEVEGTRQQQISSPNSSSSENQSEERERRCDAIVAGMARSSKLVRIMEAALCFSIGSLAILLLIFQKL